MKIAALPPHESKRLQDLNDLGVIYTPAEHRFDRITDLACKIFDVPVALVSLIAGDCQWFKSVQGLTVDTTSREVSFCAHTILRTGPFIVEDTLLDPDFADNPLVTGPPHIRFYAGCQIVYSDSNIGTLCVIDTKPRQFDRKDVETLESLGKWIEYELKNPALSQDQIDLMLSVSEAQRRDFLDPLTGCWNKESMAIMLGPFIAGSSGGVVGGNAIVFCLETSDVAIEEKTPGLRDFFLKDFAARVRGILRPSDMVFRISSNAFLAYIPNCPNQMIDALVKRLKEVPTSSPFKMADQIITGTVKAQAIRLDSVDDDNIARLMHFP